jgi:hypothetical protein
VWETRNGRVVCDRTRQRDKQLSSTTMSESHPATAIATLENEEADDTNLGDDAGHDVSEPSKPEKGKAKAAPPAREPGKSLLPAARVSKILKADEVCAHPMSYMRMLCLLLAPLPAYSDTDGF